MNQVYCKIVKEYITQN